MEWMPIKVVVYIASPEWLGVKCVNHDSAQSLQ